MTIRTVFLSVQALLGAPNPDNPLTIDIGKKWKDDEAAALRTALEWTRLYAPVARVTPTPRLSYEEVFKYSKLGSVDETRLLRLHPGSPDDDLVGSIDHAVLPTCSHNAQSETEQLAICAVCTKEEVPSYEALSYAWGDPKATDSIHLHHQHSQATLSLGIASNCAQAPRRIRHVDKERVIWVDAICINQADLSERSAQVRIMHRIYKMASQVLIYLGESSPDSDKAIDVLNDDANGDRPFVTDRLDDAEIEALSNFFNRDWFHRVWVLQEVAWAKSALVLCGSRNMSWRETVHKAYWSSIGRIDRLQPLPYVMSFGEPKSGDIMTPQSMLCELRNARDCRASDARDKIYALLELFQKRPGDNRLTIDYTRPLLDLYKDVSNYLLGNMGINILSENFNDSPTGPTWVIDWIVPSRYRPSEFRGCHAGRRKRDQTFTPVISPEEEKEKDKEKSVNRMEKIRHKLHRFRTLGFHRQPTRTNSPTPTPRTGSQGAGSISLPRWRHPSMLHVSLPELRVQPR